EISREVAILRCASLFYCLGRPGNMHVSLKDAIDRAVQVLGNILADDLLRGVKEALSVESSLGNTMSESIQFVLGGKSVERLAIDAAKRIAGINEESFNHLEAWQQLDIRTAEKIVDAVAEMRTNVGKPVTDEGPIALVIADVSGIQHYIANTDRISQLQGASLVIDGFMKDHRALVRGSSLHHTLIQLSIPIESVVMSGGGVIVTMVAARMASHFCRELENGFRSIITRARLVTAVRRFPVDLKTDFMAVYGALRQDIAAIKNDLLLAEPTLLDHALGLRCQSCGVSPAAKIVSAGDSAQRAYCEECFELHEKGLNGSFRRRFMENNGQKITGVKWNDLSPYVMEFLGGNPFPTEESDPSLRPYDLAMIKADGNLAGRFMAETSSLAALVEKNVLLTEVLEGSVERARKWLVGTVKSLLEEEGSNDSKREADLLDLRLKMGLLYLGGDDLLQICPSQYSIPYALRIGQEFIESTGGTLGISLSVLTFDAKSPIRLVMETSEHMLEYCKTASREITERMNKGCLVLDYEMMKGSTVGPRELARAHKKWRNAGLIERPLVMAEGQHDVVIQLARAIGNEGSLTELVRATVSHWIAEKMDKSHEDPLKKFWGVASEIIDQGPDVSWDNPRVEEGLREEIALMCMYMIGREKSKTRDSELYRAVGSLVLGSGSDRMGLIDAAVMARILMGG
ncbi:MAG: Cas10/Cmr2 second palm domain-containing protein, partial [Candidatus Thorarchaeota archaeon]